MTTSTFALSQPIEGNAIHSGGTQQLGFSLKELTNGQSAGVQLLTLRCGSKRVDLIPTRGMGIWKAENDGVEFGWDSPIRGPVHPTWVPVAEPSGLGWLAGFDEMLVRCGLSSNGAPEFDQTGRLLWPLHGRIANLPAHDVEVDIDEDAGRIVARGIVNESRFHFYRWQLNTTISLDLESNEIEITDVVTNLSDRACSFQLLYHNNFGQPVLGAGSIIHAAVKRVAPRNEHSAAGIKSWRDFLSPDSGFAEQVYFLDVVADVNNQSLVMVANASNSCAASIRYDASTLPCFSVWKNTVGLADGYVTGLEPATNFPNPRSFEEEHGRVVSVEPGQSVNIKLAIGMLVGSQHINPVLETINELSVNDVEILDRPDPALSALE